MWLVTLAIITPQEAYPLPHWTELYVEITNTFVSDICLTIDVDWTSLAPARCCQHHGEHMHDPEEGLEYSKISTKVVFLAHIY